MKRKGFTLVELLVVIAIMAMLMGILMPALAKVRSLAQRVVCSSHLSSIGKSLMVYANEYSDKYVRAGGPASKWGQTTKWDASPYTNPGGEVLAYGLSPTNNKATVGASLYYLIKYADATPKIFVCGGDTSAKELKLASYPGNEVLNQNLMEAWDFGPFADILTHYSYAYHYPFPQIGLPGYYPINTMTDSGFAIMADRTPYLVLTVDTTWEAYKWKGGIYAGTKETEKWGNTPNHKKEGQNVLFNDGHTSFENVPYCGFNDDNIYTMATTSPYGEVGDILAVGTVRQFNTSIYPITKTDSVLLNEGNNQGYVDATGAVPPGD
jgi:prepilin-type N-terminal cleavage/methylation domain-containing protein